MATRKKSRSSGSTTSGSGTSTRGGSVTDRQPYGRTGGAGSTVPGYNGSFNWTDTVVPGVKKGKDPESVWWSNAEGNTTAAFLEALLSNISNNGNLGQNYSAILNQIISAYGNNNAVDPNLIASIFNSLLGYAHTQDQRQYDWALTQDSRIYNSPTNELARLMGAGISRDAALQLMSGGSAGSVGVGSGTAAPVASPVAGAGAAALNSSNAHANLMNNIYNGIGTGMDVLTQLVNMGVQVPQAIEQTRALRNQNVLTGMQSESYQSVSELYGLLQYLDADEDSYKSIDSAVNFVVDSAKSGNAVANDFISSGATRKLYRTAAFSSNVLSNLYKSERSSQDYATQFEKEMRKYDAENSINEANVELINKEIANAGAEYDNILSDTAYKDSLKLATDALGTKYSAEAEAIGYENQSTANLYGTQVDGKSYLDWRSAYITDKLVFDAKMAAKTKDDKYVQSLFDNMVKDAEVVNSTLSLEKLALDAGIDFSEKYPEQFKLWSALDKVGFYRFMESKIKAYTARDWHVGGVGSNDPVDFANEFEQYRFDDLGKHDEHGFWYKFFNWKPFVSKQDWE